MLAGAQVVAGVRVGDAPAQVVAQAQVVAGDLAVAGVRVGDAPAQVVAGVRVVARAALGGPGPP